MKKPAICICKNKGADQLHGNHAADQCLCFRYIDSIVPLISKSEISICGCTGQFVSGVVGNQEDRLSCNTAHIMIRQTFPLECPYFGSKNIPRSLGYHFCN